MQTDKSKNLTTALTSARHEITDKQHIFTCIEFQSVNFSNQIIDADNVNDVFLQLHFSEYDSFGENREGRETEGGQHQSLGMREKVNDWKMVFVLAALVP